MPKQDHPTTLVSDRTWPVFVYGTLRPGQKNFNRFLFGRILASVPATVTGRLYFVPDGGYPYLLPEAGRVAGDLMDLDPRYRKETLRDLDALEEYDPQDEAHSVYLRRQTEAVLADGRLTTAWVYYWNCPDINGIWIPSGDFLVYERSAPEREGNRSKR